MIGSRDLRVEHQSKLTRSDVIRRIRWKQTTALLKLLNL